MVPEAVGTAYCGAVLGDWDAVDRAPDEGWWWRGWRYGATVCDLGDREAVNGVAIGCYGVATLLHFAQGVSMVGHRLG